jgi:hypothetical protein
MIYGEMEFLGIIDVPRISTMVYIDNTKWDDWIIRLSDEHLQIQIESSIKDICLEDILTVDRPLPYAILNKIQNSSKHGAVMVIDYKKPASLGVGDILCSMIFAGKKSDISNLKYMLTSLLGIKVDPLVGNMKPEDIRLLCLLASGVNNVDILVPIFDGDEELLNRTFSSLKKRELVDAYAALTPLGIELVDRVKGVEKKKLGSNIHDRFSELSKIWEYLDDIHPANEESVKIVSRWGKSMQCGNVLIADIKTLLLVTGIEKIDMEMCKNFSSIDLTIYYGTSFDVTLRSRDYSIMIALYGILNEKEDKAIRILFCFYLGYTYEPDVFAMIHIHQDEYVEHCKSLAFDDLIDWYSKELTNAGLDLVHKKIKGDMSVIFDGSCLNYTNDNFKKIETTKKECAKKRVLNTLQKIHGSQEAAE